jgi:hypothetical protein
MITGNEPAMPLSLLEYEGDINSNEDISYECKGLTIREQFAAMAMQGILSSCDPDNNPFISPIDCAVQSVKCADALIKELNKEK